jgi:uncharacterized protein (TIGR02328 family)
MRLWHQKLIPYLPRQQLLGQHRECCALRGKGWGKKHSVVNYVFTYAPDELVAYHYLVMDEMIARGYHPDEIWLNPHWRGSALGEDKDWCFQDIVDDIYECNGIIYDEHDDKYLKECIDNLRDKGIDVSEMEKLLNG